MFVTVAAAQSWVVACNDSNSKNMLLSGCLSDVPNISSKHAGHWHDLYTSWWHLYIQEIILGAFWTVYICPGTFVRAEICLGRHLSRWPLFGYPPKGKGLRPSPKDGTHHLLSPDSTQPAIHMMISNKNRFFSVKLYWRLSSVEGHL